MLVALLLACAAHAEFVPAPQTSTAPIAVVFPPEGFVYPTMEHAWLIGRADPKGRFQIDGETVAVEDDGAYMAWLPVSTGAFAFHASLSLGASVYSYVRNVTVTPQPVALPKRPVAFDPQFLSPAQDEQLRAGDWLKVRARVSPGAVPQFRLASGSWRPMRAVDSELGLFEGAYLVRPQDRSPPEPIHFRAGSWFHRAYAESTGKVEVVQDSPRVAVVRGDEPRLLRVEPGEGYLLPVLEGSRLLIGGHRGQEARALLPGGQVGWIEESALKYLPPGAAPPHAVTGVVSVKAEKDGSVVQVELGDRVPFSIEESADLSSLTLLLDYTSPHTNWIVYDQADDFLDQITVSQRAENLTALTIHLKPGKRLWGYWTSFEGDALRLELRRPPHVAARGSPLAGIRVFLDPGHMPSAPGAIGPLGVKEMDVNYAIARQAAELLRREGAIALLSRSNPDDEVSLVERPRLALEQKADVLVSIHNNFLSPEADPFHGQPHGYSVFYYYPHSLRLAQDIYAAYQRDVPLPGEDLRFGDLLVCRLSAMPAVLTESAYLSYPRQERLLLKPDFRETIARAVVDGLRAYFQRFREKSPEAR